MTSPTVSPPLPTEYAPYYGRYISLVTGEVFAALQAQARETSAFLSAHTEADGNLRYAPEKWTVKQVLGHVCDTERVFAYRALRIARADQTPIEGFEQDDYVRNGPFIDCRFSDLIEEFVSVRHATLSLFRGFDADAWMRRGVANKNEVTVRALAYIIAGHELHHRRILQEKYFALS
jgi:hypothetical protein